MKYIIEKLKNLFLYDLEPSIPITSFRIIKSKKGIMRELVNSKETERVVGIYCPVFGEGMFLTCVEDIFTIDKEEIIVFKPYDLHGIPLQRNHISLTEVISVTPFEVLYTNPILKRNPQKELV